MKLQNKASTVGFDWNDPQAVLAKIREETDEIESALAKGDTADARAEIGDLLFAVANLARHLDGDPEAAIRATNAKFQRRFAFIEVELARRGIAFKRRWPGRNGCALGSGQGRRERSKAAEDVSRFSAAPDASAAP